MIIGQLRFVAPGVDHAQKPQRFSSGGAELVQYLIKDGVRS